MHVEGKVDIQVTIDESGNVISAKAASGSPFLRNAAENAAWKARFSPTILNGTPVKVTGVIVYNFTRN
jgi:protein TonB